MKERTIKVIKTGTIKAVEASYHDTSSTYQGNPLIEALREEPDLKDLRKHLAFRPKYNPAVDADAPDRKRREMIEALSFFFEPLPRHVDLVNGIFSMIRKGYAPRNPAWGDPTAESPEGSLESAGLFGPSGTGKTKSVRQILRLIPQVIHHSNYRGSVVDETQVTWLRVECPATPRALCASILEKTDDILGTNYDDTYGGTRSTTSDMMPGVHRLVRNHSLGVLVIDEIQNLFTTKNRSNEELESFIVHIVNDWGVPVLLVGTSENFDVISQNFRIRRRLTGLPQPQWGRLDQNDPEWTLLTNALLKYRYVKKDIAVDKLRPLLFDLTQGIPDLLRKLFTLALLHAINEKIEEITPEVLQAVMKKSLYQNDSYLDRLRRGLKPSGDYQTVEPAQQLFQGMPAPAEKPTKPKRQQSNPNKQIPLELLGKESTHEAAKDAGMVFQEDEVPH